MKPDRQAELSYLISKCKAKLRKLQPHLDVSEVTSFMYNKILVEKAVYQAELNAIKPSFFKRLMGAIRTINPDSKQYICDYFK